MHNDICASAGKPMGKQSRQETFTHILSPWSNKMAVDVKEGEMPCQFYIY